MVSFIEDIANVLERHGKCKNMPAKKVAKFIESSLRALDKVTGQEEEKPKKEVFFAVVPPIEPGSPLDGTSYGK